MSDVSKLALAAAVLAAPNAAMAASCDWLGGAGQWGSGAGWSCGAAPGSGDVVTITTPSAVVSLTSTSQSSGAMTLGNGDQLSLNNSFLYQYGDVTNNGTITLANYSRLQNQAGALTYSGTGAIVLDNSSGSAEIYGGTITFGAGQTVRGSGAIGLNGTYIINNGVISADVSTGAITIDPAGGSGGASGAGVGTGGNAEFYNTSVLQANGGTLNIGGGLFENSSTGVIKAINSGTVVLQGDSRIVGGTLTSDSTSTISAVNNSQYLNSVTLSSGSRLNMNNDFIYVNTNLVNNGTITLANYSRLSSETPTVAYTGTGTIVLDDTTGSAQIYGGTISLGSGQTVRGSGEVGLNATVITNNGLISADVSGRTITLDATGGSGGMSGAGVGTNGNAGLLNNTVIQATNGATLLLNSGLYENAAGAVIKATNGSTLTLGGDVRILNGTLTSDATSTISAVSNNQYLQTLTLSSGSRLNMNNDYIYVNTNLVNNGTITLANYSRLSSETPTVAYTGTGTIVLDDTTGSAQIYGGTISLGSGQTVRGSGEIGLNATVITNNGLISADVSGRTITIDATGGSGGMSGAGVGTNGNAGLLNNTVIQATNGATLLLNSGLYENAAGAVIKVTNGSTLTLGGDVRILNGTLTSDATSTISAVGNNQYLQTLTLSSGSRLNVNNDYIYVNTGVVNDGTITLANYSRLSSETPAVAYTGNGTIVLDDTSGAAEIYSGAVTFGSGQTVRGSGALGLNGTIFTNNGVVSADVSGRTIDIDATGGSSGLSGAGVGTGGNAGFYNTGTLQAANGGALAFEGGLYENAASGQLKATTGSTITFNGDSNLANLQSGGVLSKGVYTSTTTGAQSTLDIRSNASNGIVTIGTAGSGTDTVVTLSGANSELGVIPFSGGSSATIDSTLTGVARTGQLNLLNGRNLTVTAGGGAFTNAGVVQLGASTLGASSFSNSGTTYGNGTITVAIANTGTVNATGGTLSTLAITGPTGTISTDATGTLTLGGTSTAGYLTNNGHLGLSTNSVTVTTDYQNANFGSGNAFNGHANVTGSGLIQASSATMDLSGPSLSGATLDVGNVRIGGSSSTTLTVTNNGTATILRGAVQNTNAPSIALQNADFTLNPNGAASTATISYTGTSAGSLAGQTLKVVNNFDNVAAKTVNLAGNVYQIAVAGGQPTSVALAAQRVGVGASTSTITVANVAPNTPGFTESLSSTASTASPFKVNGVGSVTTANLAAGTNQTLSLSLGAGTAGSFSGTVAISNTSIPVTGSGFTPLALAGQSIAVTGNVYATAVANVLSPTVDFGVVRQGSGIVTGAVSIANGATGALTDNLVTTVGATPSNVTPTAAPGTLAAGQSGLASFALNTSTAGQVSGSASLGFASTDAELAPLALASQSVGFTGTITQLSKASLLMTGGAGTFTGSGSSYTLNLGTISAGSGSLTTDLAVLNDILKSSYSESLGGGFVGGTTGGYTFTGASFSGLAGGDTTSGDLLSFNYTGLGAGTYTDTITLDSFSHYDGLADQALSPITLKITANIQAVAGGVPEPATWAEMIMGFGVLGAAMRRRGKALTKASVNA